MTGQSFRKGRGQSFRNPHLDEALTIINNWRSSHAYPLNTFQMGLRRAVRHVRPPWIVAQRIKRLPAIRLKLSLNPNMALSQMQDIGGCRAVVATVGQVKDLVDHYQSSRSKQQLLRLTDYIAQPRRSGYRSVHAIFKYHSDNKKNEPLELTRFRGHPMVGAERTVHDAEEPPAVPAGVPATHHRAGAEGTYP